MGLINVVRNRIYIDGPGIVSVEHPRGDYYSRLKSKFRYDITSAV
jgi:hypothetical protein